MVFYEGDGHRNLESFFGCGVLQDKFCGISSHEWLEQVPSASLQKHHNCFLLLPILHLPSIRGKQLFPKWFPFTFMAQHHLLTTSKLLTNVNKCFSSQISQSNFLSNRRPRRIRHWVPHRFSVCSPQTKFRRLLWRILTKNVWSFQLPNLSKHFFDKGSLNCDGYLVSPLSVG